MITEIISFGRALFHRDPYNKCYNEMEDKGIAVFGCCCGITGGDRDTNYLSYECISCPYLDV